MGKAKSFKISKVKRSNYMRHKLHVRKSLKRTKRNCVVYGQKAVSKKEVPVVSVELTEEEKKEFTKQMIGMMDEEDIEYLMQGKARTSLEILSRIRSIQSNPSKPRSQKKKGEDGKATWEELYEAEMSQPDQKQTKVLLPIKTKDGVVAQSTEVDVLEEEQKKLQRQLVEKKKEEERGKKKHEKKKKKKEMLGEREGKDDDLQIERKQDDNIEEKEEEMDDDMKLLEESGLLETFQAEQVRPVDLLACRDQILKKRKFQIGLLASGLLEAPEIKIRNFKFLLDMLDDENSEFKLTIRKLVAVSLLEVFKDLLPSYQIKHQETNQGVKLKKATMLLQNFEKSLLKAYKKYLQSLERMASVLRPKVGNSKAHDAREISLGVLAVRCLSELLVRHPYFNFSPNIGQSLVLFLNCRNEVAREIVMNSMCTVLKEDKKGSLSLHIVRRINHLVKKANHAVQPQVLSVLLALRLKDINLDAEKEAEMKEKKFLNRKQKLLSMSKRERKRSKRLEELEKEMLETKAEENKNVKQKYLTDVTKTVFTIFFRVLKQAPTSKLLKVSLEGLAKFAHCINLEFFQDLVNVLDSLLKNKKLGHVEQLHCVETVFTILSGQGEALNIDPLRFYTHLYQSLLEVHAGCTSADVIVVLRTLEKAIIARRRKMSFQRLLAFIKRLCTLALHLMHGGALGYLAVVQNILTQSRSCESLLDTDTSHGSGFYLPELPEPEYCGAGASVLWELPLLRRHYHPDVQKKACAIMKGEIKESHAVELTKLTPVKLAEAYDCSKMAFKPVIPPPRKIVVHPHHGRLILTDNNFSLYLENIEKSINENMFFNVASACGVHFTETTSPSVYH